jgi:hypothetical protein
MGGEDRPVNTSVSTAEQCRSLVDIDLAPNQAVGGRASSQMLRAHPRYTRDHGMISCSGGHRSRPWPTAATAWSVREAEPHDGGVTEDPEDPDVVEGAVDRPSPARPGELAVRVRSADCSS